MLKEFQREHTKLFMSFDLAGSTAFKQRTDEGETFATGRASPFTSWTRQTHHFYAVVNRAMDDAFASVAKQEPCYFAKHFKPGIHRLWKGAGDELIFERIIERGRDIPLAVLAFFQAYRTIREAVKRRSQGILDVKAAGWVAGFPSANIFLPINDRLDEPALDVMFSVDEEGYRREMMLRAMAAIKQEEARWDYVGPGLDTGFRVASMAKAGDVVISVDLAFLVTEVLVQRPEDTGEIPEFGALRIDISDWRQLKGIWGDKRYPRFRLNAEVPDEELKLQPDEVRKQLTRWTETRDQCRYFYDELRERGLSDAVSQPPFVMGCNRLEIGSVPADRLRFFQQIMGANPPSPHLPVRRAATDPAVSDTEADPVAAEEPAAPRTRRTADLAVLPQMRWMSDLTMRYMEEKIVRSRSVEVLNDPARAAAAGAGRFQKRLENFLKERKQRPRRCCKTSGKA